MINPHSSSLLARRYQDIRQYCCKSLLLLNVRTVVLNPVISNPSSCIRRKYFVSNNSTNRIIFEQVCLRKSKSTSFDSAKMKLRSFMAAASAPAVVSAWTNLYPHLMSKTVSSMPRLPFAEHISSTAPFVSRTRSFSSGVIVNEKYRTVPTSRLLSTVAFEEEAATTSSIEIQSNKGDTSVDDLSSDRLGNTIAQGTIFAQYPGGFVAIKINEDFASNDDTTTTIQLQTDGLATPKKLSTVRVEVGDYQGKQVLFSDGSVGVVVAHRAPLIFVYKEQTIYNQNQESNENLLLQKSSNIVNVKSQGAKISVSSLQNVVDCFGRPVDSDEISTGTFKSRTSETTTTSSSSERLIFSPIPQVKDIALINNPMLTGITMIDSLASIGRGQNMLLVGHDFDNMRSIVIDFLKSQVKQENTKCIYASTEENHKEVLKRFSQAGLDSNDIHLVTSSKFSMTGDDIKSNDPSKAAEAVVIASTACAIGESYALNNGAHALVIVDAMDYHKKLWDCTTRLMVDVFGVDAVVKSDREGGSSSEMRVFFSSLVQRAAQYKDNLGGGSVTLLLLMSIPKEITSNDDDTTVFTVADFATAPIKIQERINVLVDMNIPLTVSTLRKIKIPIPTDVEGGRRFVLQHVDDLISMSDGQIWLDERLELSGRRPPVDPQRSVTRIGIGADTESRADAPALRRIAEGLRLELAQASDNLVTTNGATSTVTKETTIPKTVAASQYQNRKQQSLLLAMHQESTGDNIMPRRLSESCIVLLAAQKGLLNKFIDNDNVKPGTEQGTRLINDMLQSVNNDIPHILTNIDKTLDITEEEQDSIIQSIKSFVSR
jgi:F0F1-type ATP synthase alpha subunit